MVGWGRHRSPADRARTLAAIEIAILFSGDLVRTLVRCHPACSGEGRAGARDIDARDRIDAGEQPDNPPS